MTEAALSAVLPYFDAPASEPRPSSKSKPKSYKRRDAIWFSACTMAEKAVLEAVCLHMGFDDTRGQRACSAGEARLGLIAGQTPRNVRRCIKALRARGVLVVKERARATSLLTVNFAALERLRDPRIDELAAQQKARRQAR